MTAQTPYLDASPAQDVGGALDQQLIDAEADSLPPPTPPKFKSPAARLLFAVSLVLIAFNLRPVFPSLSVVLPEVIRDTGLSTVGASLLTTLPVLCLGVFAPFAPGLAQRYGAEKTLAWALLLLGLGTALRGVDSVWLLFFGTFAAGSAIAVSNVLLPGVVKRDFPEHTAIMTGLYTMALCGGSAAAAGLTLPLEHALGSWPAALAAWAVPAFVVLLIFLPQALRVKSHASHRGFRVEGLWRDRLAWQVTLFTGLQSALAYCVFGWLAPMLRERGFEPAVAGGIVSLSVMVQVVTCLGIPSLAVRCRDQRGVNVALVFCATVGLLGMMFAPTWSVLFWAVMQGIGQGGLIAAAMMVIVLRASDSHVAAHLSGMAQGVGYVLAAVGPLFLGLIRGWTGSFDAAALLIIALGVGAGLAGAGAGRALHVNAHTVKPEARKSRFLNFFHIAPKEWRNRVVQGTMMAMMLDDGEAPDADLIGRARDGDRAAFGALVERHYDFVHRVAWRWSGSRTDAEDIAQEVCVRMGRSIRGWRGEGAFSTWLYAMTLNAARDMARKNAREAVKMQAYGAELLTLVQDTDDADEQADGLWHCVRLLPDKQREAVLLVYGEGLTHAVAADAMAISEATVSWHIHEAKKRLKVLMRQAGEV